MAKSMAISEAKITVPLFFDVKQVESEGVESALKVGVTAGATIEIGGVLSCRAIISQECGLPAIANARGATRLFKDGERVAVDASGGEIKRLELG